MKRIVRIFVVVLLFMLEGLSAFGQFMDMFDDGDYTDDPEWIVGGANFIVNEAGMLQTASETEGEAWIFTRSELSESVEWTFRIKLAFAPSDNNYSVIWLCADDYTPVNIQNGYYLRFGETGSNDAIELYSQKQGESQLILRGIQASISSSFIKDVKVMRFSDGTWQLYTKNIENEHYILEAEVFYNEYFTSEYFGIFCKFTKTNSKNFYYDNFIVQSLYEDKIPPCIKSCIMRNSTTIALQFSEPVVGAGNNLNYILEDNLLYPVQVEIFEDYADYIRLVFFEELADGKEYMLCVSNIADYQHNMMSDTCFAFTMQYIDYQDIVISEIMYDVNPPPNNLPPYDYLELYNKTSALVDVSEWTLSISGSEIVLPHHIVISNGYLIVTTHAFGQEISANTVLLSSLNIQKDDNIALKNGQGDLIFYIQIDDNWYQDAEKQNGGWSLEMANPYVSCITDGNWFESIDEAGGTPGRANSVEVIVEDTVSPKMKSVTILDLDKIILKYSETMDSVAILNGEIYNFQPELIIKTIEATDYSYSQVEIVFENKIQEDVVYTLKLDVNVSDCVGNTITDSIIFGIGAVVDYNDIVFNEVLFNSSDNTSDYVELINISGKVIDIQTLKFGIYKENKFSNSCLMSSENKLMMPGDYLLITSDTTNLSTQYPMCDKSAFWIVKNFPNLNNQEGCIGIVSEDGTEVDKFCYSSDMHLSLLNEEKGISLEKMSVYNSSDNSQNWHSAAKAYNYGSPGIKNSQFAVWTDANRSSDIINVEPKVISPNNDGTKDFVEISYDFDEIGGVANIYIYNQSGVLVRHLVDNELLAVSGCVVWNGYDENGIAVQAGNYIVLLEKIDMKGGREKARAVVCVVAI
jgi:hypothetical protein